MKKKNKKTKKKEDEDVNRSVPFDVSVEILSRLPIKSLFRFKTASKEWCSLMQNPILLNLHFDRSNMKENHTCLFLEDLSKRNNSLYAFYLKLNGEGEVEDNQTTTFVVKHDLPKDGSTAVKAYCKGLLCYCTSSMNLWVCNLSTTQHIKLPRPPPCIDFMYFGLGFNPSTNKYIIVVNSYKSECYLFTLGAGAGADSTSLWRKIASTPPKHYVHFSEESLCVNGVLHWNSSFLRLIIWFDLRTEEFGVLPYPTDFPWVHMYEFHGSLCLLYTSFSQDVGDLWVLKDYNNHSWDHHRFDVPHPFTFLPLQKTFKNWDIATVFSTCEKYNRSYLHSQHHRFFLDSYNLHTCVSKRIELIGLPPNANIKTIGYYKENKNMIASASG